jgi:hypothetical protein
MTGMGAKPNVRSSVQTSAKLLPCAVCTPIWRDISTICSALGLCRRFIPSSPGPETTLFQRKLGDLFRGPSG